MEQEYLVLREVEALESIAVSLQEIACYCCSDCGECDEGEDEEYCCEERNDM